RAFYGISTTAGPMLRACYASDVDIRWRGELPRRLMAGLPTADVIEIEQLLAKYAVAMTKNDIGTVIAEVFTPDGSYSAFGSTYTLRDFPALVEAAPKGLFLTGTPLLELDGDTGTGEQPLLFVDQASHDMRMGWYTDSY